MQPANNFIVLNIRESFICLISFYNLPILLVHTYILHQERGLAGLRSYFLYKNNILLHI